MEENEIKKLSDSEFAEVLEVYKVSEVLKVKYPKSAIWTTEELKIEFHAQRKSKSMKTNQFLEWLLNGK